MARLAFPAVYCTRRVYQYSQHVIVHLFKINARMTKFAMGYHQKPAILLPLAFVVQRLTYFVALGLSATRQSCYRVNG